MRPAVVALFTILALARPLAAIAATDDDYDKAIGVDKGRSNGTLKSDPAADGKSFTAPNGFGKNDCPITFNFEKAEKGTYPYVAAGGKLVKGVNVKISVNCDWAKCKEECPSVKVIQFVRNVKGVAGKRQTGEPTSENRKQRSGWSDPNAPSRGWRVDETDLETSPFYVTDPIDGEDGSTTKPAIERDSPGDWDNAKNVGKEFLTCAICPGTPKGRVIACLRWGYFIDGSGNVSFDPAPQALSPPPPVEAKDAAARWDAIAGNTQTNVSFK